MPDTLGDLKQRIISETLRDDLADTLKGALDSCIKRSIEHYEFERWWFNEAILTTPCVPGSQNVAIDPTITRIDMIRAVIGGVRYEMAQRSVDWVMAAYATLNTGQPTDWASLGEQLILYPQPNLAYPLQMQVLRQVQPPLDYTDDTSSNVWTNTGQDLICARSKIRLYRDYLSATAQDPRLALAMVQEDEAYVRLRSQSNRRTATGVVQPAW